MDALPPISPLAFYAPIVARIGKEALPPMPETVGDEVAYAIVRMRMLARKGNAVAGMDADCAHALDLALRIREDGISPRARAVRRKLAARAALKLGRGVPLKRREAYLRDIAGVAGCLARLLYFEETDASVP